jgi:hypothetical protein
MKETAQKENEEDSMSMSMEESVVAPTEPMLAIPDTETYSDEEEEVVEKPPEAEEEAPPAAEPEEGGGEEEAADEAAEGSNEDEH